jgi:glycosyltransferase involved in cell wall biosynthesis
MNAPYLSMLDPSVIFKPFILPRARQPFGQVGMINQIFQQIRRFDPDVIHLQQGHLWFNFALPFLRQYPLVITIHDPRYHLGDRESSKMPQFITDFGHRRGDQLIVHAETLKQVVIERLQVKPDIVHAIPTVVRGDAAARPEVQEEDNLILFFGRIWEYKGLEYLIRAEPLITAQIPDARIVIAGRGENFNRYQDLMVHPERFTVYNDYVSDDKRAELFRRASVVALPYVDASQSGVIPVAYTYSKPVVATTVGGLPELVDDGRTGFLVPPRDEQALANALVRLLRDKILRHQLGANGKHKIDSECSPEAVAHKTIAVYRKAIGN